MDQYLLFAIIGLGSGCLYAALSLGLVITYRGTGIINFATGAMALWAAYVYDELIKTGDLVLPVVIIRSRIGLGGSSGSVPFSVALILALLSCVLIGLMVHFLIFRPLRRAPVLARVVASVGALLVLQALIVMNFTSSARVVAPILPNEPVSFAGISFSRDRLWLTAVVLATATAAWAWFRFTRLGLATRASTENERGVSLARYSPQALAGSTWVLSSTVVGFLFIMASPIISLGPANYLLIVPALAAAVIGRLLSIAISVTAALGLGIFQSIIVYQTTNPWWPDWAITGIPDALPFGVIVIALFGLGHTLPTRGAAESSALPEVVPVKMRTSVVASVVAVAGLLMAVTQGSYRIGIITSMIMTIVMLSLVVLTGLVGQISLAQAAIAGAAGFTLSTLGDTVGIPFPISLLLAVLMATAFGLLVGIPALRIRGAQLAVVTLAGAVALEEFVLRNTAITGLYGNPISGPSLLGADLSIRQGRNLARMEFGILVIIVVTACAVAVGNLARSATGRRFLAVRSNERAGASAGINVAATKMIAFAFASFLAGLGGAFIGYSRGQLSAESFAVLIGLSFLALAYLSGITSVPGAIIAGLFAPLGIVYITADRIAGLGRWYQLASGVALIATAIFFPEGIAGAYRQNLARWRAFRSRRLARAEARGRSDRAPAPVEGDFEGPVEAVRRSEYRRSQRQRITSDAPIVLSVKDLTVRFGGLKALDQVSLRVRQGEIVGLIGPNGAGKTTLIDALTGFVPSRGSVTFCEERLSRESPHVRAQSGLTRTWQSLELFDDLTVRENVQVAAERPSVKSVLTDLVLPERPTDMPQVDSAMEIVGVADDSDARPSSLPLGRQKLVGVARALASAPRVMLADEPAAGLSTAESVALGVRLLDVASEGVSILLIDHDMNLVLDICDYVYVLNFGQLIAEGTPTQIRTNEAVVDAYLGSGAHA